MNTKPSSIDLVSSLTWLAVLGIATAVAVSILYFLF